MEAKSSLVWTDCVVELHSEAAIDLNVALVVNPGHAEHNLTVGLDKPLEYRVLAINGVGLDNRVQTLQNLVRRLHELVLSRILALQFFQNFRNV